jgi:hypothetical protein
MPEARDLILGLLEEKSIVKQDVYFITQDVFDTLKEVLKKTVDFLADNFEERDSRVEFYYKDKGPFEAEVKIAGDVLIFYMHTNVFQFDKSNSLWRSSYLKEDESRGYVGAINIYNFLADSFRFQRANDLGYLIARIFINRESHFLVQGKRQLGFLYNNFIKEVLDRKKLEEIIDSAILYTLDFDLYTPPYQQQQEVSVKEIQALSQNLNVVTGKRLGFRFSHDDDGDDQ